MNANGTFATARRLRVIPVESDAIELYSHYQYERDEVGEATGVDTVLLNLFHPPLGEPMKYASHMSCFAAWPGRPDSGHGRRAWGS